MTGSLASHVENISCAAVHPAIASVAQSIRQRHGNVLAILAYGSALRDATPENTLIDFYVLVADGRDISRHPLSRRLAMLLPPNVYYAECSLDGKTYRAKYAALTSAMLARKVRPSVSNPYFWARFAQPMRLVWSRDGEAKAETLAALMSAMATAQAHARALRPGGSSSEQWKALFTETYRTELRPESGNRAGEIVEANLAHYETVSRLGAVVSPSPTSWAKRRWQGKLLSVLRLLKAAFTFQGGADYAAWKIKRHSGVDIEVKPWHRRHPVIASIVLLPELLRRGALK